MTWKEFKDSVEKQGVKDTDRIDWIDIRWQTDLFVDRVEEPNGEVSISIA